MVPDPRLFCHVPAIHTLPHLLDFVRNDALEVVKIGRLPLDIRTHDSRFPPRMAPFGNLSPESIRDDHNDKCVVHLCERVLEAALAGPVLIELLELPFWPKVL